MLLCISMVITFLIRKSVDAQFPGFSWSSQKSISCFVMILIIISIVYNSFNQKGIKIVSIQLLIWGLIFLIIIIGYAFRFELNYTTQRVVSVLIPSYNWVNKQGELVISRSSDGHFYIDVLVNGVKIKFMIDTGASDVALTTNDAKMLGFDLSKLHYTRIYSTANGTSTAAPVKLDSVVIDNRAFFRNIEAHIGTGGLDISLLGMSVLERFKSFRIDRDMLILSW
ncbi:TIGR02281 family clan AA aspartic protease [Rickettsia endosymbiont of Culicoides newsteadi]|uniref:TIGR02281 family clan AA aspartic protease n=1 Tax=Rickettsia endosymbiont of Culicoides newsteadi TaxID=1961830 RepID=UPI000B9C2CC8|nr:TIGR02281 family clan AA aspartic protease [Rickettsia endosymbiont of Culicoides newsteadi]